MKKIAKILDNPVCEKKLASLLSNIQDKATKRLLEASGIVLVDNHYFIVFDEMHGIARLPKVSDDKFSKGEIIGSHKIREGYEAIAYDSKTNYLYAIVENSPFDEDFYRPQIQQFDMNLNKTGPALQLPINLPLDNIDPNKGLEGASIVHRGNKTFLFGLCEGKGCNSDDSKNASGRGMIQIFEKIQDNWQYFGFILLPQEVDFRDFADIAIQHNRIAIVSQQSSKLWIGRIKENNDFWEIKHLDIYSFPRKKDKVIYCNVEGVDWNSDSQVVIVSDKASKNRCKGKEMMIHLFALPK